MKKGKRSEMYRIIDALGAMNNELSTTQQRLR